MSHRSWAFATLVLAASALGSLSAQQPAAEGPPARERVDRYGDALPPGVGTRLGTVRYRHGGGGLAFLADGKTVVSVRQRNTIALWDAPTGRLQREIDTGQLAVGEAFAFAHGAKRLAVSGTLPAEGKPGWRSVVRVFDSASGKELRTFEREPRDGVNALALSPDGRLLFSLGREGKLRVEEVATGVELLRQKFPGDVGAALALSPDGSTLAVSSGPNSQKLFLWKWQSGQGPHELQTPPGYRGAFLTFAPDGKRLAVCSDSDTDVRVWDVASGKLLHRLALPDHAHYWHRHAAFSPDGKVLAACGSSNYRGGIHLWDPATGKFLKRLHLGSGSVIFVSGSGLAFSPDGTLLAAGSRVWDFATGKELSANDEAHREAVEWVVTGGKDVVVTASEDTTIRIWDAATGKQQRCLVHDARIRDIALSPDGSRLVSSSLDDTVCLWDVATGRKLYALAGHGRSGGRGAVVFTPDGKSFLSWGDDMYLRQWDVRTGKALLEHAIRPTGIRVPEEDDEPFQRDLLLIAHGPRNGRLTPDGKHLILQADRSFFVFDSATGQELRKFPSAGGYAHGLTVSPDSKLLLASARNPSTSSPRDHSAIWWALATGKQRGQIILPEGGVWPVAFSANGKHFAVASSRPGELIRLVEVATGKEVRRLEGFRGVVRALAFTPDGRRLVSGMDDSTALIWDLTR